MTVKPTGYVESALFEHRFWLQVLGDHARFIYTSLSANEAKEVHRACRFIETFDKLLADSRQPLTRSELDALNPRAYHAARQIRDFKLHLLRRHLRGEVGISLSPSFLNHIVSEVEEYLRILEYWQEGREVPPVHPIHHHMLWLQDAYGHSATISQVADFSEVEIRERSDSFTHDFESLYLKAVELAGYLRTHLDRFPALDRFNHQVDLEMRLFQDFLNEIQELELSNQVLGALSPLMPDHMWREECYYLMKLSGVTELTAPACDPTRPRVEEPSR
jgi:hypothetical protein